MQKTKFLTKAAALLLAALILCSPAMGGEPIDTQVNIGADLLWARRFGAGYQSAPTAPLVSGDYIYVFVQKNLVKMDRFTGEIAAVSAAAGNTAGYGIVPPAEGGGMIFVPLKGGTVAAFDRETLELLWQTESLGGQSLTPVTYADGKIFYGTWVTEERSGYYCGYSVDKSGCKKLWTLEHTGGFYRAGALYEDGKLTFGSDDGADEGKAGASVLYSVDAETGDIISMTEGIDGDIRSDIVGFGGGYIFSTKAGYIYKVKDGSVSRAYMGAACASTPAVIGSRAYAGTADKCVTVVDLENMTVIRKIAAAAYPNGGITIYGNRIYATCNALPGGVYVCGLEDDCLSELYTPDEDAMKEYCISPVSFGSDGMLYYKNDSGYIFALSPYADVSIDASADETVWLVRPDDKPVLEEISLKKGSNNLKINGGGRAMLWHMWLEPLTEVIYL